MTMTVHRDPGKLSHQEIVAQAKRAFSAPCTAGDDPSERELLYGLAEVFPEARILDLGTGSGYMALYVAERCETARVVGLDIAEAAIERAKTAGTERGLSNAGFLTYEGLALPFADGSFDRVISRYALHHFPDLALTVREIARVLSVDGRLTVCDCIPTAEDEDGSFIDAWMRIIGDGHVRFRGVREYEDLLRPYGYRLVSCDRGSTVCRRRDGEEYAALAAADPTRYESYRPCKDGDSTVLTLPVARLVFVRARKEETP